MVPTTRVIEGPPALHLPVGPDHERFVVVAPLPIGVGNDCHGERPRAEGFDHGGDVHAFSLVLDAHLRPGVFLAWDTWPLNVRRKPLVL